MLPNEKHIIRGGLALKGTEGFEEQFRQALEKGQDLVERINTLPKVEVRAFEHGSNIFPLTLAPGVDAEKVVDSLRHSHVFLYPDEGTNRISRLTVNTTILRQSDDAIFEAFKASLGAS